MLPSTSDDPVRRRSNRSQINVVFQKVLFQLSQDVFPVGVFAERGDVRPDFVHEQLALGRFSYINHLLHHVVGVLYGTRK